MARLLCKLQDAVKDNSKKLKKACESISSLTSKVEGQTRTVYRYEPSPQGVGLRRWLDIPDAVPHDNTSAIWAGPIDPETGHPSHPNAPTSVSVESDFNFGGPDNQQEHFAWIEIEDGYLRDNNLNTGERGEVFVYDCCGNLVAYEETIVNTPAADRGIFHSTYFNAGLYFVYARISDLSANGGFDLEYSADDVSWANYSGFMQPALPVVECQEVSVCDPIPDGWSVKAPKELCKPVYSESGGLSEAEVLALIPPPVTVPAASNATPIPDNEVDTTIRTGQAGTSADFARADHNHPIRRQGNPGDPVLTFTGTGNMTQSIILDRESDEESYAYKFRNRVTAVAGTGWDFITVPPIAGFQQPEIYGIGTYRQTSNSPQDDDGVQGAAPRGPFMGKEAHEWSSTRRVYLGYFRRDNAYTTFVEFWVRYTRT